ncbi:MAG: FAD-binding oxidoreductase [Chloroflexi bacterium]|nr:FAD-binding oxidoreductase [Chloroflexota bacterium]MBV9542928.1 FAD-binding oxidoreductase [Chloroflexota bacterium]
MDSTDVLIVGGGVLGCATAYYLARSRVQTLLIERGAINREASGANAGTLHIQIPAVHFRNQYLDASVAGERRRDFRTTNHLYAAAADAWGHIEQELDADLGVRLCGGLMVAESKEEMEVLEAKAAYERCLGMQCEVLGRADALRCEPSLGPSVVGASYCPNEGFANPLRAAPAFIRRAVSAGARLRVHTRMTEVEPSKDGWLVETSNGTIRARRIVLAAGAQTRQVLALFQLDLPILAHPLQVMVTAPQPPLLQHLLQHAGSRHLSLRQTQSGTFLIGGGWPALEAAERRSSSRVEVRYRSLVGNAAVATDVVPALKEVPLIRAWAAMTTATGRWNRVGYIGEDRRVGRGKLFALVAGGWGFTLSPVLGRLAAELVVHGSTSLDIEPFSLERALARM